MTIDPRLSWTVDQLRVAGLVRTTCDDCAHAVIVEEEVAAVGDTSVWCHDCLADRQAPAVEVKPIDDTELTAARGEVVQLRLAPPPPPGAAPDPIPEIVETLRSMLARAEAGEIRDLGLAFHTADGAVCTIIEGHADSIRLLAATDILHARTRQRVRETES